jgi:hypothetical protein
MSALKYCFHRLIILTILATSSLAIAAEQAVDFSALRAERAKAIDEIDTLRAKVRELEEEARVIGINPAGIRGYIDQTTAELSRLKQQVETLKKAPGNDERINFINAQISTQELGLTRAKRDKDERDRVDKVQAETTAKLRAAESSLVVVETKISELLARDVVAQKFKGDISLYFAAVIGLMVILFFGVIFYDETVRTVVFAGPTAIQFVTLFSIIIAIILFGITGILGDKELAALLGGLSGYILGKYNESSSRPRQDTKEKTPLVQRPNEA